MTKKNSKNEKWDGSSATVVFLRSGDRVRCSTFAAAIDRLRWKVILHRLRQIPRLIEEEIFG